jgi:hypothetical protein
VKFVEHQKFQTFAVLDDLPVEAPGDRLVILDAQQFAPGRPDGVRLYALHFCRTCGQEHHPVRLVDDEKGRTLTFLIVGRDPLSGARRNTFDTNRPPAHPPIPIAGEPHDLGICARQHNLSKNRTLLRPNRRATTQASALLRAGVLHDPFGAAADGAAQLQFAVPLVRRLGVDEPGSVLPGAKRGGFMS